MAASWWGRGWHDRLAGTVVVRAPVMVAAQSGPAGRSASEERDMDLRWREFMRRDQKATGEPNAPDAGGSQG